MFNVIHLTNFANIKSVLCDNFFLALGTVIIVDFFSNRHYKILTVRWGIKYMGIRKICTFRPKSPFVLGTVQDRPMVTIDQYEEVVVTQRICVTFDVLE